MKAFQFSLKAVLVVKEIATKQARQEYVDAKLVREHYEHQLKLVDQSNQSLRDVMLTGRKNVFAGADQSHYIWAGQEGEFGAAKLRQEIAKAREIETGKLAAYLRAKRALEKIKEIRDSRYKAHVATELRKEEQDLEDAAAARFSLINSTKGE